MHGTESVVSITGADNQLFFLIIIKKDNDYLLACPKYTLCKGPPSSGMSSANTRLLPPWAPWAQQPKRPCGKIRLTAVLTYQRTVGTGKGPMSVSQAPDNPPLVRTPVVPRVSSRSHEFVFAETSEKQ